MSETELLQQIMPTLFQLLSTLTEQSLREGHLITNPVLLSELALLLYFISFAHWLLLFELFTFFDGDGRSSK